MKRIFSVTLVLSLFFVLKTAAQIPEHFELSAGIKIHAPLGTLKDQQKIGLGFDLQGEIPLARKATFIANTALTFFGARNSSNGTFDGSTVGFIPFLGGVRIYLTPRLFIGGQVGYGLYQDGFLKGPNSGGFSYSPQIGFNSDKGQIYFYFNSTQLNKASAFMPTGNMTHIGGSMIFRGVTDFLY